MPDLIATGIFAGFIIFILYITNQELNWFPKAVQAFGIIKKMIFKWSR
jgi:hypothetical protein